MPLRPEPGLASLLDDDGAPAPGALGAIVERHRVAAQRRMRRVTAASLGVALAAVGVAASSVVVGLGRPSGQRTGREVLRSTDRHPAVARGSRPAAATSAAAPTGPSTATLGAFTWVSLPAVGSSSAALGSNPPLGRVPSPAAPRPAPLGRVLLRRHAGVALRAFFRPGDASVSPLRAGATRASPSGTAGAQTSDSCPFDGQLAVETSSTGAIGALSAPEVRAARDRIAAVASGVVGVAEGDPAEVVVVRAGRAVARVAASFASGGNDAMAVRSGWAVLVDHPARAGTLGAHGEAFRLDAFGPGGRLLERVRMPAASGVAVTDACFSAAGAPVRKADGG